MTDTAAKSQSLSTPGTNMDTATAELTALQAPLSTETSDRFRVVCLSGPIKIMLPISAREETENLVREPRDLHFDASTLSKVSANTIHNSISKTTQLSQPTDIKGPIEVMGDTTHMCSPSNTQTTGCLSSPMETSATIVKKPDHNHPEEKLSPFCPYLSGSEIVLNTPDSDVPLKAVIIKTFTATLSCCMVIRFVEPPIFNNISECVIKLYDRRFSNQLRTDWSASLWTPELENEYQNFVARSEAEEYFSYWDAEKERFIDWSALYVPHYERWNAAKLEAYLQWKAVDSFETEKKAYERMADLQGEDVPKIFGEVVLNQPAAFRGQDQVDAAESGKDEVEVTQEDSASTTSSEGDRNPQVVNIPGILMQYIDGFLLSDLHEHPPRDRWQSIVDSALKKLNRTQERGIFNIDAQTRSFLIDSLTQKVMMIDFGMVRFREDLEDDEEWETYLCSPSQEKAIGAMMKINLKVDAQHHITYNPSEQYWRLLYRHDEGERENDTVDEEEYVKKHKNLCFDNSLWIPSEKKV